MPFGSGSHSPPLGCRLTPAAGSLIPKRMATRSRPPCLVVHLYYRPIEAFPSAGRCSTGASRRACDSPVPGIRVVTVGTALSPYRGGCTLDEVGGRFRRERRWWRRRG